MGCAFLLLSHTGGQGCGQGVLGVPPQLLQFVSEPNKTGASPASKEGIAEKLEILCFL